MFLYLVRHAEAIDEKMDPARHLCERGVVAITKMASYASGLDIGIAEISHSPKLRAKQTAQILADYLRPPHGLRETDGLKPNDNPAVWAERLKVSAGDLMLVGHLPHLGKLTALLLCGDADMNIVEFRMAGIVCLKRDDYGAWSLQWMITPEIIVS